MNDHDACNAGQEAKQSRARTLAELQYQQWCSAFMALWVWLAERPLLCIALLVFEVAVLTLAVVVAMVLL